MIRLYIDWNVMSQMKSGAHTTLFEIVTNDNKFFKLYSTSHIADIAASDQSDSNQLQITSDLEFIEKLTDSYCVYNTGKDIQVGRRCPKDLYAERTDLNEIRKYFTPGEFEESHIDLDPQIASIVKQELKAFKDIPGGEIFKEAFENPEIASTMRQFLPDLENNFTAEGIFNAFLNMFTRMNETDEYKKLRELLQNGAKINRDKVFDTKNPFAMIKKVYERQGLQLPAIQYGDNNAPAWFNKLTNEYISLDMHGYQEDKVSIANGRKQTFRNTMEDAFHSAFATTCDFYITNDDRNYKKTEMVYSKLGINSLVMRPEEFVTHYNNWLHFDGERSINLIPHILEHVEPMVGNDVSIRTYFSPIFILDYFNKVYAVNEKESFILLSRAKPTNSRCVFRNELETLINKLLKVFGEDVENLGSLQDNEDGSIRDEQWNGRVWLSGKLQFKLSISNGYLQLYITDRKF